MADWIVLIIFLALPILLLPVAPRLVWRALRTGELEARGRSYFRSEQPRRFWFGIVFWIVMTALSLVGAVGVTWRVFGSA